MNISVKMTSKAPPATKDRMNLPPGTKGGSGGDCEESEYLSDQDIAAGRTPNNTKTAKRNVDVKVLKPLLLPKVTI